MNDTTLTLTKQTLPNGCVAPLTAPVVQAAVKAAIRCGNQRGVERFLVKVDGEAIRCKTVAALTKVLDGIAVGATCRVFRNAGHGATIDFTN